MPAFEVGGIVYRKIIQVIKSAFQDSNAKNFHLTLFKLLWQSDADAPPERVIGELYSVA